MPRAKACSTPASTLLLRSGFSEGLSVKAISNAVGGLMPVPPLACRRVQPAASARGRLRNHVTDAFGFADQTTSASNAGLGPNGFGLPSSALREIRSTRTPATMLAGRPAASVIQQSSRSGALDGTS
jgi:hypothetical protein